MEFIRKLCEDSELAMGNGMGSGVPQDKHFGRYNNGPPKDQASFDPPSKPRELVDASISEYL